MVAVTSTFAVECAVVGCGAVSSRAGAFRDTKSTKHNLPPTALLLN